MLEELGISFGTALMLLVALYFIIKWAVKNGIQEAYAEMREEKAKENTQEARVGEVTDGENEA